MTSWIYTIQGLGSASTNNAVTEINLEFNLLPGMGLRLWNMMGAGPIRFGSPSEENMIDEIIQTEPMMVKTVRFCGWLLGFVSFCG